MSQLAERPNESHTQKWLRSEYERFGSDYVNFKGAHLFENGAIIDGLASIDPPGGAHDRAKLVLCFWELKLAAVETRFEELKNRCLAAAEGGFSPEDRAKLLAIAEEGKPFKIKVEEAKKALEAVVPYHLSAEGKAEAAKRAEEVAIRKSAATNAINEIRF